MRYNPQVVFMNREQMIQHAILSLVAKTMEQYVILALDSCVTTTTFFIYECPYLDMTHLFL
jgi:hypothetical protein